MSDFDYSKKPLQNNEIRIIKLNKDAVAELLLELLMSNGADYFGLPSNDAVDDLYSFTYNHDSLVYMAYKYDDYKKINFDSLERFIAEHLNFTTDSLFNGDKSFVSISISDANSLS